MIKNKYLYILVPFTLLSLWFLIEFFNTFLSIYKPLLKNNIFPNGNYLNTIYHPKNYAFNHTKNFFFKNAFLTETNFTIEVDNDKVKKLNKNIPFSGFIYQKANFYDENENKYRSKIRYRGDGIMHWLFPKKSWRIKTSKEKLYRRNRKFNLIIPKGNELINNHYSYLLAKNMGLLAPESFITDLSINNSYEGIKLYTEQINECFLLKNKRMPGDIYKGDYIGKNTIKGVYFQNLFNNHIYWDKIGVNNHYNENSYDNLSILLYEIRKNNFTHLSLKKMAKFSIFQSLTHSYHIDNSHNWILYYDNYLQQFEPIVWDALGWWNLWGHENHPHIISSKIFNDLYQNFDFIRIRNKELLQFSNNNKAHFYNQIVNEKNKAQNIAKKTNYHHGLRNPWFDWLNPQEVIKSINVKTKLIPLKMDSIIQESFKVSSKSFNYCKIEDNDNFVRIKFNSFVPIKSIRIVSKNFISGEAIISAITKSKKIEFRKKINTNGVLDNINLVCNYDFIPIVNTRKQIKPTYLNPINTTYDIQLPEGLIVNSIVAEMADLEQTEVKFNKTEVFNSVVIRDRINIFSKNNVRIELDENALNSKLIESNNFSEIKNKVDISNVKVNLSIKGKNISLLNQKANNSTFTNCEFSNGSDYKETMFEYTGMVNVHNADSIVFKNCTFKNNLKGDDMVHIVYSSVTFDSCTFINAKMDALDCDISEVTVKNCTFINSGNDALDLMESKAIVENCKFINSIDKGISVGENSTALIKNCEFTSNKIGVESKDDSKATIENSKFVKNGLAINSYKKNWRYNEPGEVIEYKNSYSLNDTIHKFEMDLKHIQIKEKKKFETIIKENFN